MHHAMFVDFNAYFAAAEQHRRPELRGRPVAVVPTASLATCCIASSQEARRFKIKTGTKVSEALRLCPGLQLIDADPPYYLTLHKELVRLIDTFIPVSEVRSIDEMLCSLTGRWRETEATVAIARKIKTGLRHHFSPFLTCSIGIAANEFLAKTATDMQKPDGLVVLEQSELPQRLFSLQLRDLCGIGEDMEKRLLNHGLCSVEALCLASREKLHEVWGGIQGQRFYDRLHGQEVYTPPTRKTVVGHSNVLAPCYRNTRDAFAVMGRLTHKAALRLRRMHYRAGRFGAGVQFESGLRWGDELNLTPTSDTLDFLRGLHQLWDRRPERERLGPPKAVSICLSNLEPEQSSTLSLFTGDQCQRELHMAMDQINGQYGTNTVYFGGMHDVRETAPMRIAFHHLPEPE